MRPLPISLVAVLVAASPACAVSSRGFAVMNRAPSTRRALVPATPTHRNLLHGTKPVVFESLHNPPRLALGLPAAANGLTAPAPTAAQKPLRAPAAPVTFAGARAASSMGRLGSVAPIIEGSRASGNWSGVEAGLGALWGEKKPPQASRGSLGFSSSCTGCGGGSSQGLPPGGRGGDSTADGALGGPGLKLFFQKGTADYDRAVLTRALLWNPYRLERVLRRMFKLFPEPLRGHLHVRSIDHLTPKGQAVITAIEYTLSLRSGPGKKATFYGYFTAKVNLLTGTLVLNSGRRK